MYPYFYPVMSAVPPCYYRTKSNNPLMRGGENPEDNRSDTERAMPPMSEQMMDMVDMGKITTDTQEIVIMFERHHPDIIQTLTECGMSIGQARQYLTRIVGMTLMHHTMHQE